MQPARRNLQSQNLRMLAHVSMSGKGYMGTLSDDEGKRSSVCAAGYRSIVEIGVVGYKISSRSQIVESENVRHMYENLA